VLTYTNTAGTASYTKFRLGSGVSPRTDSFIVPTGAKSFRLTGYAYIYDIRAN
jgi:hypothetical protein